VIFHSYVSLPEARGNVQEAINQQGSRHMLGEMWANYHDVAILFSSQVRPFMANREEL
jgi:hypothetical protein